MNKPSANAIALAVEMQAPISERRISGVEWALSREAEAARDLLAIINADEDEALAGDMVEGETSLHEAITAALDMMDQAEALSEGIKALVAKYGERKTMAERRAQRIRAAIQQAMQLAGLKSLQLPAATLTVKPVAPKPIIEDESLIPADFWKPQAPTLDKAAINAAARSAPVPGVTMSNGGEALQIRRK